jgi:hypothetical protein
MEDSLDSDKTNRNALGFYQTYGYMVYNQKHDIKRTGTWDRFIATTKPNRKERLYWLFIKLLINAPVHGIDLLADTDNRNIKCLHMWRTEFLWDSSNDDKTSRNSLLTQIGRWNLVNLHVPNKVITSFFGDKIDWPHHNHECQFHHGIIA